jgi:hypothetical protein
LSPVLIMCRPFVAVFPLQKETHIMSVIAVFGSAAAIAVVFHALLSLPG